MFPCMRFIMDWKSSEPGLDGYMSTSASVGNTFYVGDLDFCLSGLVLSKTGRDGLVAGCFGNGKLVPKLILRLSKLLIY